MGYGCSYRGKFGTNKSFDDTKKSLDDQLKELDSQLDSQLLSKVRAKNFIFLIRIFYENFIFYSKGFFFCI